MVNVAARHVNPSSASHATVKKHIFESEREAGLPEVRKSMQHDERNVKSFREIACSKIFVLKELLIGNERQVFCLPVQHV